MSAIEVSQTADAPAATAWSVITDLAACAEWMSAVDSVEILAGERFGPGTRWRETRTMFGRKATEEMTVSAVDEGRGYEVEAASRGARYHSTLSIEPAGEGTLIRMRFESEAQTFLAKVISVTIGRLFAGATRKALVQDLADVAAEAERRNQ